MPFRFNKSVLIIYLISISVFLSAQDEGDELFDPSYLHEIKINSPAWSNVWDSISKEYVLVNLLIDGNSVDSVGIELKGTTSANSTQKPLEVDLNKYVRGQKYDGLKKFVLRNNFEDAYLQRERLALELYRRAGLPSSRTSYVEVYVDDLFRGVYSITEMIDKTFLKHYYPSDDGSLYKGDFGFRGLSVKVEEGSMAEFDNWKRNMMVDQLGEYINLDHYLKQLAIDIIVGDWDSYAYNRHNFYIYFEPRSQRLHFINWDHNFAFSAKPEDQDLYPLGTFPSLNNMIEAPALKAKYEQTLCELLTYLVDDAYVTKLASDNVALIHSNQHGVVAEEPTPLLEYITLRKQRLQDTLTTLGVTCKKVSCPIQSGDILIKQVLYSVDKNQSDDNVNGNTSSRIDLQNTTDKSIILDGQYYLSDDADFPKKWRITQDIHIPSGATVIIMSDEHPVEQDFQVGFYLRKKSRELLLTHEDMTEVHRVRF